MHNRLGRSIHSFRGFLDTEALDPYKADRFTMIRIQGVEGISQPVASLFTPHRLTRRRIIVGEFLFDIQHSPLLLSLSSRRAQDHVLGNSIEPVQERFGTRPASALAARDVPGGTAPSQVAAALKRAKERLGL